MEVITSKSNEKVKYIKSLNDKKFRHEYQAFYLEGIKVVKEVIQSKRAIDILFIAYSNEILTSVNGGKEIITLLDKLDKSNKFKILNIEKNIFEGITDTKTPQGILAVLKIPKMNIDDMLNTSQNVILLDRVQDLGNVGTIIRSADAFGIKSIICLNGTADVYSPKVIRSTMGSILRENIVYINEDELINLKKYEHNIVGTSLNTDCYITDYDFSKKSIFVFGNEANGIQKSVENICDNLIKIKMSGSAESLNVSVAAGIILHEQFCKKI